MRSASYAPEIVKKQGAIEQAARDGNRKAFNAGKESLFKFQQRVLKDAHPKDYRLAQTILNIKYEDIEGN